MTKSIFLITILFLAMHPALSAQPQFSGTTDVGISSGGSNSSFIANGISNDFRNLHFSIPQVNLLMFAPINESFYVEARLQSDTWGSGRLGYPRFTLANLTWDNPDNNYSISAGRFISPIGIYSKRNLTIDRTFYDFPLIYSYFVNISDRRGHWPQAGVSGDDYYSGDTGLSTIYFGGYSTGILLNWLLMEDKLNLETAITSVAPASTENYTNLANAAILAHLTYTPNISWQLGLSVSHGSFMQSDEVNDIPRINNALEQYRQTLIGVDLKFGLGFWELTGEAMLAHWKVPYYNNLSGWEYNGTELVEYNLSNAGMNIDLKYEPPMIPGSYIAFRADKLLFLEENASSYGPSYRWDDDVTRLSAAFGYKLSRNVVFKIVASEQTPFDQSLYSFRTVISAFF